METEAVSDCCDAVRPVTPSTKGKKTCNALEKGFIGVTESGGLLIQPDSFARTDFRLFC
jgi:hypothetical protein